MKNLFKLNTDMPTQHLFILAIGGAIFFLNIISYFKVSSKEEKESPETKIYTTTVDEMTGEVSNVETRYENPHLSWYQRIFCRGFQRSSFCSLKTIHPLEDEMISQGIKVPEGEAEKRGPVYFKGSLNKNSAFSNSLVAPEAEVPDPRIQAY